MSPIRLPLLLYSYIATELLAPFFACFVILYGIFFLVRLIPLLDVVLNLGIGMADFIRLFSYLFPHLLLYVIPMTSMAGVIIAFTRLTSDREILALKSCGISLRQMLPAVILVTGSIAALTGFFSIHLIPAGEVATRKLMFQLAKEKIDKGLKEKQFTEALGALVVYVDRIDEEQQWHGVYVSDMRNREQPIITMARNGHMVAEVNKMLVTIILNNGTLHNIDGTDNQVIRFKRYQLQIPLKPPTRIDGDDVTTLDKGSMTQAQLLENASLPKTTPARARMYLVEYHHRLVLPVGCFILSLLGMPLGLQAETGKKAIGIPLGLGFFLFYYILLTVGGMLAEDGVVPLVPGMWAPNIILLFITMYVFLQAEKEQPLVPEKIQEKIGILLDWLVAPLKFVFHLVFSRRRNAATRGETIPESRGLFIHANGLSLVYHLPGCEHYNCENCTIEFKDVDVAEKAGFTPCRFCKKLVRDLEDQEQ